MKENLTQFLLSLGLSEQRAKLYLACLSLGKATASELAKAVNFGRTAVYDNLDFLEEKGFLSDQRTVCSSFYRNQCRA